MKRWPIFLFFLLTGLSVYISLFISFLNPPLTFNKIFPLDKNYIKEARFWQNSCAGVQCQLCPFGCFLPEGQRGICRVRMNCGNKLYTLVYAQPVAIHIDPIEKKPVYHMLPGSAIFSLATVGCNLRCKFCQNWEISQSYPEQAKGTFFSPREVVEAAIRTGCSAIAYTYSEPTVFFEYVLETSRLAKENGLKNVLVSAGYINPQPLKELVPYFDVVKIDLKGFNEKFYRQITGGHLQVVLDTLLELKRLGVFTEIVNLVVPTLNDNLEQIRQMCIWIKDNLGPDTPLFFSRFSPQYQLANLPSTPIETLEKARQIAREVGLHYVYLGNVPGHPGEDTYCPVCGSLLIDRYGYKILRNNIVGSRCKFCGAKIPGIWDRQE